MKRIAEVENKNVTVGKSRDKALRSRNKRKYKRKKNARTIKRACQAKEGTVHYRHEQPHQRRHSATAMHVCNEIHLKHTQNVWIRAYHRVVKWHTKYQTNYWKQYAQQLKMENVRLKRSIHAREVVVINSSDSDEDHAEDDPFGDTEDETVDNWSATKTKGSGKRLQQQRRRTSKEDDDDADERDEIDEEFVAFMEVSARHRLEHQRQKNESVH